MATTASAIKTYHETLFVPYSSSDRSHKLIVLPNGILTLLISDPAEDLASAALCVSAGAHNDPDDIPGLAHFCEHLVLLGSKEYPNPNEFHDCISKSGGRRNAFTTGEQTCYYFETPSDSTWKSDNNSAEEPVFNHLLKVFASCLGSPSFDENIFEKEIYSVDSEHTANKNASGRLMYHGLRLLSNENHPFHRFATGNFFTLNDLPKIKKLKVREHLLNYYEKNYVADKMTLVIRGSQSINLLQKLATSNFSDIRASSDIQQIKKPKIKLFGSKTKKASSMTIPQSINEFDVNSVWDYDSPIFLKSYQQQKKNCIFIRKDQTPTLRLTFPIHFNSSDSIQTRQLLIFQKAWSNIVGDEGEGSLDSYLKKADTITGLGAFTQHLARDNNTLVLELKLTNTGANKIGEIINLIFNNYLPSILKDTNEIGRFLSELNSIDILTYLYKDTYDSPMEESSSYAKHLQENIATLGAENILKGEPIFTDIKQGFHESEEGKVQWIENGKSFQKFIYDIFNLKNLRLILLAGEKIINKASNLLSEQSTSTEEHFNFDFITGQLISSFPKGSSSASFNIVQKNQFLPSNASSLSHLRELLNESTTKSSQSSLGYVAKSSWSSTEAKLAHKGRNFEIWTKTESSSSFASRLIISFDIVYTSLKPSPEYTMHIEILSEILKIKFAEKLYAAELLDYSWEIFASLKGDSRIGFTISGFKGGVELILSTIVEEIESLKIHATITKDEFRKSRVAVRSRYRELVESPSIVLAATGLLVVMEEFIWSLEDRLDALDVIDIVCFKDFIKETSTGSKFLRLFVQGEVDSVDNVSQTLNKITNHLDDQSTNGKFKEPSTVLLAPGKSYYIERPSSEGDPMNAISYFIQTGPRGDKYSKTLTKLYSFLMSLSLVPDLRTKKQLGYVVLGGQRILRTTLGLHITVMSAGFTPCYLEHKIDEYLFSWKKSLEQMNEEEFQDQVIKPFLKNYKQALESTGGPESLTADLQASVGSSNSSDGETSKVHKRLRDLIFTGAYDPKNSEAEDFKFITNLKRDEFLQFFQQRILPGSKTNSKVSVMLKSRMSSEEIQQQMMRLQLEAFLKMHGLRISSEKLKEIVDDSKGGAVSLMKGLFKHFIAQGESLKLCTLVLKEVTKQVTESMKFYRNSSLNLPENAEKIVTTEIIDILDFKRSNKVFYRT